MLHGEEQASVGGNLARRRSYGVVEWEVEFDLLVWIETNDDGGEAEREASMPTNTTPETRISALAGAGRNSGGGGSRSGVSLSVYHFPDICTEGGSEGRREGKHTRQ